MTQGLLVVDAGPLIALAISNLLAPVFSVFGQLIVPQAVLNECLNDEYAPGVNEIKLALQNEFFQIIPKKDIEPLAIAYAMGLGSGEIAVLAYAAKHSCTVVIDDRKARRMAKQMNIATLGTGTLIVGLKLKGRIDSIRPCLQAWEQHGYFITDKVRDALLFQAGELQE